MAEELALINTEVFFKSNTSYLKYYLYKGNCFIFVKHCYLNTPSWNRWLWIQLFQDKSQFILEGQGFVWHFVLYHLCLAFRKI